MLQLEQTPILWYDMIVSRLLIDTDTFIALAFLKHIHLNLHIVLRLLTAPTISYTADH